MAARPEDHDHVAARRSIEGMLSTIERSGLTPTEFRVLAAVADEGSALAELADRLELPAVTVRRASRHLAMRGLIRRRHGARRQAVASLTASGLATLRLLTTRATQLAHQSRATSLGWERAMPAADREGGTFSTQRV